MRFLKCISLMAVAAMTALGSAVSAEAAERTYNLTDFDEIEVNHGVKVNYIVSSRMSCKAEGPDEALNKLKVDVVDGTLKIGVVDQKGNRNDKINMGKVTVTVTGPVVTEIDVTTSASFRMSGNNGDFRSIDLSASTSGQISIETLKAKAVECEASTSGSIHIGALTASAVSADASTSASIKLPQVTANNVEVDAETSASVMIAGKCKTVDLDASTSGSVAASGLAAAKGGANASTSGSISCNIASPTELSSSTGGKVRNN